MGRRSKKKTTTDQLTAAVSKILDEYGEDVKSNLKEIVAKLSKEGAKAVRSASKSTYGGTGKYASGWRSRLDTGRLSSQGIIYNARVPGLPHLLEYGHAKRGGGRVSGRPHIKPVEEKLISEFEREVKSKL